MSGRRGVPLRAIIVVALLAAGCSSGDDAADADRQGRAQGRGGPAPSSASSGPPASDPTPGCAADAPSAAPPGRTEITLTSGGADRRYVLYHPGGLDPDQPAPLVLDFPAYSPAATEEAFSGFTQTADDESMSKADEVGAVVVTPEPIGGEGALRAWNLTGDAPGFPDDMGFVRDLLADVGERTCVDRGRTLAMGFAVGGVMAARVACEPDLGIAVLVSVAGPYRPPECQRTAPLPVLAFHGTEDPLLPLTGGVGPNVPKLNLSAVTTAGLAGIVPHLVGAQASAEAWAERGGCDPRPRRSEVAPGVTRERWTGCDDGAASELYVTEGAGHTWPGSRGMDGLVGLLGPTTDAIVANDIIWDFFGDHTRP